MRQTSKCSSMSETLRVVTTLEILSLTRAQRKIFYQTVLNLFHQLSPLRCISGLKVRRKRKEREHSLPIMRACTMNNRATYQRQGFTCSKPFLGHIMHNGQEHSPFIRDVYRDLYRLGSNCCTRSAHHGILFPFPFHAALCRFSPDRLHRAVQARLCRKCCRHVIGLSPYHLSMTSYPLP